MLIMASQYQREISCKADGAETVGSLWVGPCEFWQVLGVEASSGEASKPCDFFSYSKYFHSWLILYLKFIFYFFEEGPSKCMCFTYIFNSTKFERNLFLAVSGKMGDGCPPRFMPPGRDGKHISPGSSVSQPP